MTDLLNIFEQLDSALKKPTDGNKKYGTAVSDVCKLLLKLNLGDTVSDDNLKRDRNVDNTEYETTLHSRFKKAQELLVLLKRDKNMSEQTLNEDNKELAKLKRELAKKEAILKSMDKECENLSQLKPSEDDQYKIDKYSMAYKILKKITGIRWDYTAPESMIRGYIKNGAANSVHSISITSTKATVVSQKLWTLMGRSSLPDWETLVSASYKENTNPK